MVRCQDRVGRAKAFLEIRNFFRTDNWKDRKWLPQQIAEDDFRHAETCFGLERFDAPVAVFVLRMVKEAFHQIGCLRDAAIIQTPEISIRLWSVGNAAKPYRACQSANG